MKKENKSIPDWISHFIKIFPNITKEQSDYVLEILHWEPDKRAGFVLAKRLFEEKDYDSGK